MTDDDRQHAPEVPPLTSSDTALIPDSVISQLLGIVSTWIDVSSPDPVIYDVSRQVLKMEVAFAAFCGLTALILPTPRQVSGRRNGQSISQYASAIREALEIGSYIQFSISMPMMETPQDPAEDNSNLAHLARIAHIDGQMVRSPSQGSTLSRGIDGLSQKKDKEPVADDASRSSMESARRKVRVHDFLGTWDVWNVIRSFCNYSPRLFVSE